MTISRIILNNAVAALFAAVLIVPSLAAADAGMEVVTAKGSGDTVAEAKKDAGRNAIQLVVGELLDAETLVENDELVKDRILTYSGAYLEDIEIIGEPIQSRSSGLVEVTVKATVQKTQLERKLKAENVTTKKVKGGKLFAQVTSKAQESEDATAMAETAFKDVPGCFWKVEMLTGADGSPAIKADANGNVVASVRVSFDEAAYRSWVKRVMAILDRIADDKTDETIEVESAEYEDEIVVRELPRDRKPWTRFDSEKQGNRDLLICLPHPFRLTANALVYRIYWFADGEKANKIRKFLADRFPLDASISWSLLAEDDILGMSRGKSLKDLEMASSFDPFGLCRSHIRRRFGLDYADEDVGSDMYKDRARIWVLIPSVTGGPLWGGPFNPSVDFVLPLGRFEPDDLAEATDVRLTLDFK